MAEARTAYQDFLRCGKTRTRIFRSSSRRRQSAPSCNELIRSDPRFADHSESSEHLHRQRHRRTGQPVFHLYGVSGWQVTAAVKEKVVDALGGAATKLRAELGESLATVQSRDMSARAQHWQVPTKRQGDRGIYRFPPRDENGQPRLHPVSSRSSPTPCR
jgi:hypothetical protein